MEGLNLGIGVGGENERTEESTLTTKTSRHKRKSGIRGPKDEALELLKENIWTGETKSWKLNENEKGDIFLARRPRSKDEERISECFDGGLRRWTGRILGLSQGCGWCGGHQAGRMNGSNDGQQMGRGFGGDQCWESMQGPAKPCRGPNQARRFASLDRGPSTPSFACKVPVAGETRAGMSLPKTSTLHVLLGAWTKHLFGVSTQVAQL